MAVSDERHILSAALVECLRTRDTVKDLSGIGRDAGLVATLAGLMDQVVMPRRLTPGWEAVLPARSVAAGPGALGLGLTIGGLVTRS